VRLSRLFLPSKTLSSTAAVPFMAYLTFVNSVIEHTSLFWLQAMPFCVRAPYKVSVRPPLVHTLALTLIKITRVVLSVLICQIFLVSIVCCCIRRCMSSSFTKFLLLASLELGLSHRYQAPGRARHFHRRLCWSTCYSLPRETCSLISVANPGYKPLTSKFSDCYILHELIQRWQLYLVDAQ
jgi:hypothetical protein